MDYSIEEHRHRFAAWAASRAASVRTCRFKVEQGKIILEAAGVKTLGENIDHLPSPGQFDLSHRNWRNAVIQAAQEIQLQYTHGIAAKLINIYLKSIFICGPQYTDPKICAIHPPIDSILLDELYHKDIGGFRQKWNQYRKIRWSKLSSDQYESLISLIKKITPENAGLWTVEQYWRGYQ